MTPNLFIVAALGAISSQPTHLRNNSVSASKGANVGVGDISETRKPKTNPQQHQRLAHNRDMHPPKIAILRLVDNRSSVTHITHMCQFPYHESMNMASVQEATNGEHRKRTRYIGF